jgi:hypothetical protein
MFYESDYITFAKAWQGYNEYYGKETSKEQIHHLFCIIKDFAPCTIEQFSVQIHRSMALDPNILKIQELMELASFDGNTKEQAKGIAAKRWRVLCSNVSDYCDYCFADIRACISFYLCFGSIQQFSQCCSGLDNYKNEPYLCKRFIDNYLSCSINDNMEILRHFTFHFGLQTVEPRKVIPIGNLEDVRRLCDSQYGSGKWGLWRQDLFKKYEKDFDDLYASGKITNSADIHSAQVQMMATVISNIENKNHNPMIGLSSSK